MGKPSGLDLTRVAVREHALAACLMSLGGEWITADRETPEMQDYRLVVNSTTSFRWASPTTPNSV